MPSMIKYDGTEFAIDRPSQARGFVQLLADHVYGIRKDLATLDSSIREAFKRVDQGGSSPVSLVSMLSAFTSKAAPAPVVIQQPAPAAQASIHRTAVPTISAQGVDVTAAILPGSVDRTIHLSADFTGPYQGGSSLCVIAFGAQYNTPPLVVIQPKGTAGNVNLRPLSVTNSQLALTADNANGFLVEFDIIVIPVTESFD